MSCNVSSYTYDILLRAFSDVMWCQVFTSSSQVRADAVLGQAARQVMLRNFPLAIFCNLFPTFSQLFLKHACQKSTLSSNISLWHWLTKTINIHIDNDIDLSWWLMKTFEIWQIGQKATTTMLQVLLFYLFLLWLDFFLSFLGLVWLVFHYQKLLQVRRAEQAERVKLDDDD